LVSVVDRHFMYSGISMSAQRTKRKNSLVQFS
jgi:hypothetical protein